MKKTSLYFFLFLLLPSASLYAQSDTSTLELSLDKAIEIGLQQRYELLNQELSIQITQNSREKTQSANLPQVKASIDFRYNLALQTNLLPPGFTGSTDYTPVKFGTPYNTLTAVNVTQNLYNPNVSGDKDINTTQTEYESLALEKMKTDIRLSIATAYYAVLLNKEQVMLNKENLVNVQEILKKGKAEHADGVLLKSDLDRYELDVRNAQSLLTTSERNYDNSIVYLKNQMALDYDVKIILTDNLESLTKDINPNATDNFTAEQRHEYKLEESQMRINNKQYHKAGKNYLPTVYLYGNVSIQNQSASFALFNGNYWYPFSYVGVHADIPIFDGMDKSRTRTDYKLKALQNQNNLQRYRKEFYYETINASKEMNNTYSQYMNSKDNYELARQVMATDQVRYKEGTITYAALKNTEYSLQNAQNNYLNSIYNVLIAQLNYQKVTGQL